MTRAGAGWTIEVFDELASTSDHLVGLARNGAPDRLAILAHAQTSGRGTHGRSWQTPPGNLALSALMRPEAVMATLGQWSLLAGIAVIEALSDQCHTPARLQLKWPNDVLLDGAKLAGMLIDSEARPDGKLDWLVIGIGANLGLAPDLPDRPSACLAQICPPDTLIDPYRVAQRILARLDHWRDRQSREGFPPIRAAWQARAHQPGTPLTVTLPGGIPIAGSFAGLSPSGALLLDTDAGTQTIVAVSTIDAG